MDTLGQRRGERRRFSAAFKRRVVEETLQGDESVSMVARRHDLNTNLVFNWRKRYQEGALRVGPESSLVPIEVTEGAEPPISKRVDGAAELELVLAEGHRIRIRGHLDPALLRTAIETLKR